ncbi:MAG: hypothetical protein GXO11_02460 [Epsilonproteobacteria bacterium]|nr:hypothetical protein [Campylobacterota bacterium]
MSKIVSIIITTILALSFSGCELDLFNEKEILALQKENQKLKNIIETKQQAIDKELEKQKLKTDQEFAKEKLKAQTEIEKQKLQAQMELKKQQLQKEAELKKQKLELSHLEELQLIKQKSKLLRIEKEKQLTLYAFLLIALIVIIIAFFIYLYFKRKREDKLIAYNDNLKKYFLFKENEMKMQLAHKILDTAKDGQLTYEDQQRLLSIVTAQTQNATTQQNVEVEFIEHTQEDLEHVGK